jgi:thiol-disulfide isomerase/thioredoxin
MKKAVYLLLVIATLSACNAAKKTTSTAGNYTVLNEGGKVLKGYINRSLIENDPEFSWFKQNIQGQADALAVNAFQTNASKFKMIVFGGTWCGDTQNLLPVFYRLVDKSGYADKNITLIGVDRAKTTVEDLHTKYGITRVPTFIVMHDGKEVGRVVEYGSGSIEKDLGALVNKIK